MTRVAFVQAWLTVGGAERLIQALAERMDRTRIEASIINLYGPGVIGDQMMSAGWPMVNHLARSKFDPFVAGRLQRALQDVKADVVYVWDSALPMFWMGQQRRKHLHPRVVLGFHSTGKLGHPVQHFLARRSTIPVADQLVALSETHRAFLARELGVSESRFAVLSCPSAYRRRITLPLPFITSARRSPAMRPPLRLSVATKLT